MSTIRRSSRLAAKNTQPIKEEPIKVEPMEPVKAAEPVVKNIDTELTVKTVVSKTQPVVKVIDNPVVENVSPKVSPKKSGSSKNVLKHIRLYLY